MDKWTLRNKFKDKRSRLSNQYLIIANKKITNKVISFLKDNKIEVVGIYLSVYNEVDTKQIINYCLTNNIIVSIPRIDTVNKKMVFCQINNLNQDLEPTSIKNIYQPTNIDLMIDDEQIQIMFIPGIVFDNELNRIGYGGGYYDRYFSQSKFTGLKIGLSYKIQVSNQKINSEVHDIKMDQLITN